MRFQCQAFDAQLHGLYDMVHIIRCILRYLKYDEPSASYMVSYNQVRFFIPWNTLCDITYTSKSLKFDKSWSKISSKIFYTYSM